MYGQIEETYCYVFTYKTVCFIFLGEYDSKEQNILEWNDFVAPNVKRKVLTTQNSLCLLFCLWTDKL